MITLSEIYHADSLVRAVESTCIRPTLKEFFMSYPDFVCRTHPYFNTIVYTGNGAANRDITGFGFSPDLVWIKKRSGVERHVVFDSVRGPALGLSTNNTSVEFSSSLTLSAFIDDGFITSNSGYSNENEATYVAWGWKADQYGFTQNDLGLEQEEAYSTNSGLSIIKYNGNGVAGRTIKHSLGAAPKLVIIKNRNIVDYWRVYHFNIGNDKHLLLSSTLGKITTDVVLNNTSPSTTTVTLGNDSSVNNNGNGHVAYLFSEIPGINSISSYIGNGTTSKSIICGFTPRFVMIKRSDDTGRWFMYDSIRGVNCKLWAESSDIENTSGLYPIEFVSNGFNILTDYADLNVNNGEYVYIAIK